MSELQVELTDAITRTTQGYPSTGSLSKRGHHAYMVYSISETTTNDIVAEMFNITSGAFVSTAVLHPDIIQVGNLFAVDDGHANKHFNKFSVVDDDQGGVGINPTGLIRLRIFDKTFAVLASRFDISFAVGTNQVTFPVIGGTFSDDDKYIQLTYLIDATPNAQKSRLHIMNVSDLTTIATVDFDGSSFGAQFIQIHNKTYVALPSQNGNFEFGFNTAMGSTASKLSIYRLKSGVLTLVDSADLPQITNQVTVEVSKCGNFAKIGASTRRAIIGNSIFTTDVNNASFKVRGNEMRVYSFNGHTLQRNFTKNTDITTIGPVFRPESSIVLVNEQMNDGDPSFFNFYDYRESHLRLVDGTYGAPPFAQSTFSADGKWLLVSGSDQSASLKNINLYEIKKC